MISSYLCTISAPYYMKEPVWISISLVHHAPLRNTNVPSGPVGPLMQSLAGITLRNNQLIVFWLL